MQQAYQALRVISEAQIVHIVLATRPGVLMLEELNAACGALQMGSSDGIKAAILDFAGQLVARNEVQPIEPELLERTRATVRAIAQPVLAVVRADPSTAACQLIAEADFTLIAHEAELRLPMRTAHDTQESGDEQIGGTAAARLGYATWSVPAADLNREMERILDMLRAKSAVALRHAKASVRLSQAATSTSLEALRQINQFYLENVMATQDAHEGLQSFLEKRQPRWTNH